VFVLLFLSFFLLLNTLPNVFNSLSPPDFINENNTENFRMFLRRNAQDFFTSHRISLNHYITENRPTDDNINGGNSVLNQLIMLEKWSQELNSLPSEKKIALWESCGNPRVLENFVKSTGNIDNVIKEWALNYDSFKQLISCLYDSINRMKEGGLLHDGFQSPPNRNRSQDNEIDNISNYRKTFSAPSKMRFDGINRRNNSFGNNNPFNNGNISTRSTPDIRTLKRGNPGLFNPRPENKMEEMIIVDDDENNNLNNLNNNNNNTNTNAKQKKSRLNISNLLNN